jgi:hypothetical protein
VTWSCRAGQALRAIQGSPSCGDAAFIWMREGAGLFALVDALGHGPSAEASARAVTGALARCAGQTLLEVFTACDKVLSGQRAVVLSAIQVRGDRVAFMGIGNVELYGPPGVSRPPTNGGVVGRGLKTGREWPLQVEDGQRWMLASDGIKRRSAAGALKDSLPLPAQEAAAQILQAAGRDDDDASVLVVDWSRE